jgi:hypothetical protein
MPGLAMSAGTASEGVQMPIANLTLEVQPDSDALHRIVCTCHRRNLRIVALSYAGGGLTLTVVGDEWHTRGIERWLATLVNVFDVQREVPDDPAVVQRL